MPDKPKLYAYIRGDDANFPLQVSGSAETLPDGQSLGGYINEKAGFWPAGTGFGTQTNVYPIHKDRVESLASHFDIELREPPQQNAATQDLLAKLGIQPNPGGKAK